MQKVRGLHEARLRRMRVLPRHGQVWRFWKSETDLSYETVFEAQFTGHGSVQNLFLRWLGATTISSHGYELIIQTYDIEKLYDDMLHLNMILQVNQRR